MKQPSLLVVTWAVSTCLFITFTREGLTTSVQGATLRGDQAEEEHGSNEEIIQQHTALSESIARRNVHEEGEHDSSSLGPPDCLTPPRDAADMFAAVEHEKMYLSRGQQQRFTSPTYFNVIYHVFTTTDHQGEVPDGVFSKAISILNKAYSGAEVTPGGGAGFTYTNTNIRFRLQGIQRYLDDNLALNCGDMDVVDSAIRTGYRIVGINAINVYVCKLSSACGYAYYPCGSDSQQVFQSWDCLVRSPEFGWLPPSGQTCKDKDTFGLAHTFELGCTAPGDSVDDTPYEGTSATGLCSDNLGRDTCLDLPGSDPYDNIMDYTCDACRGRFTPGQADRMQSEIDRCMPTFKNAELRKGTAGGIGTARRYEVCRESTCLFSPMPNGSPAPSMGWCHSYGALIAGFQPWGPCALMNTGSPTRKPTKKPTRSPTKTGQRAPTAKPSKKPTKKPTIRPTTKSPTFKTMAIPQVSLPFSYPSGFTECATISIPTGMTHVVDVSMRLFHSYAGDLVIAAIVRGANKNPPSGSDTVVSIIDSPGSTTSCASNDFSLKGRLKFNDDATVSALDFGCPLSNVICSTGTCTFRVYGGQRVAPSGTKLSDFTADVTAGASSIDICFVDVEAPDVGSYAEVGVTFG